jgi:hypothetical protein
MDAQQFRRAADVEGVLALPRRWPGLVELRASEGRPVRAIELLLHIRTAVDRSFPRRSRAATRMQLEIPGNYPFVPPRIDLLDPVFNPNVFPSGVLCVGWTAVANWRLADLVVRAMRVIALDPGIISTARPAHYDAAEWYERLRERGWFPTVELSPQVRPPRRSIVFRKTRRHGSESP